MAGKTDTAQIKYQYNVPFPEPQTKKHHTTVTLAPADRRFLVDSEANVLVVVRVNSQGDLDENFGENGYHAESLEVDANSTAAGFLVVKDGGGVAALANATQLGLVAFKEDGQLDTSFGKDGKIVHQFNPDADTVKRYAQTAPGLTDKELPVNEAGQSAAQAIAATEDGGFYGIVGQRLSGPSALISCKHDGQLNREFAGGIVTITYPDRTAHGVALVSTADGGVVAAGTLRGGSARFAGFFARYDRSGALDRSFGDSGFSVFDSESPGDPVGEMFQMEFNHVTRLAGGGFAACGSLLTIKPTNSHGLVACVDAHGKLLESFNKGKPLLFEVPDSAETDFLFGGIAQQADGKIVVAGGVTYRSSGYTREILVVRFNPDGSLDTKFAPQGYFKYKPFGNGVSYVYSLAVTQADSIVVAGDGGNDNNVGSQRGFVVQLA